MPTEFTTHTDSPLEIIAASDINDIQTAVNNLESGWIAAPETWTYASATTFTISGDYTAYYVPGTRIKLTNVSVKYFVVVSSAYASGVTTVTVTGGSDYALASAAISNTYYSYEPAPAGYPDWFDYTPTGVSATNVTLSGRFRVIGRTVEAHINAIFSGAITYTTDPTLPITASADIIAGTSLKPVSGVGGYFDSGTATVLNGLFPSVVASATTVEVYNSAGTQMSASSPITWANNDEFTLHFFYEI